MFGDSFGCQNWDGGLLLASRDQDSAKQPIMHRTAPSPSTKNHPALNINSVTIEKLWFRVLVLIL